VTKLGEEGKAFKKRDGTYSYPVADRRDLLNAIKAFGRAVPSEAAALKRWLKARARVMGLERLLPMSWQSKARPAPGPRERDNAESPTPDAGAASSVGGQSE
jgi:hypothetical protein